MQARYKCNLRGRHCTHSQMTVKHMHYHLRAAFTDSVCSCMPGRCCGQARSAPLGDRHHTHHQTPPEHRAAHLVPGTPAVDGQQLCADHLSSPGSASCLCLLARRLQAQKETWRGMNKCTHITARLPMSEAETCGAAGGSTVAKLNCHVSACCTMRCHCEEHL